MGRLQFHRGMTASVVARLTDQLANSHDLMRIATARRTRQRCQNDKILADDRVTEVQAPGARWTDLAGPDRTFWT